MQEDFESESNGNDNSMRPDASDRANQRERSKPRKNMPMSRQHIKIGIGILVLLLLILLVSSALKSPVPESNGNSNNQPREVNLGNTPSNTSQPAPADANTQSATTAPLTGATPAQEISAPPVSGTPTQSPPLPEVANQQRVEIPGEITDALSAQQEQLNKLKETEMSGSPSTSNTAPLPKESQAMPSSQGLQTATSHQSGATQTQSGQVKNKPVTEAKSPAKPTETAGTKPPSTKPSSTPVSTPSSNKAPSPKGSVTAGSVAELTAIPASHVTLQVSSASRSESLLAFAKKNNMTDYWVYPTRRDGKPWFILITGNYASSSEARAALSTLPTDVQANKPWVRSVQQVHQDLKQK
ncbi:SPOR domain-containing protein [Budvicia diplopodorum]|uniref:SPOR domain-containing protein n=1 Tax=Budvicia diplopodorum TaxID=1119056 RepID=UPI001358FBCC|nr:SPOR domain-containing protein [Budvicia diplopodorum]